MKERGITTIEREINRDRESHSERDGNGEGYIKREIQRKTGKGKVRETIRKTKNRRSKTGKKQRWKEQKKEK